MLEPRKGIITFRAEGSNVRGDIYYSRVIHWPGIVTRCATKDSASGVTIGRGYDMKKRSRESVLNDLRISGVPFEQAKKISLAAGLHNCEALSFVIENKNDIGEISEVQQVNLFNITYPKYESYASKIHNKYGRVNSNPWGILNDRIKDIFIDMLYQGVINKNLGDISAFESNNIDSVVNLINSNKRISKYETGRNRVRYLRDGK